MKMKSEAGIYSENEVCLDGEKRSHFQGVPHQDQMPLIRSFIHSLVPSADTFCRVLYAKQHACKEGGVVRRLPKLDVPGVASLSIRVKVRGTDTGVLIQ